jgi:hypothetical protein
MELPQLSAATTRPKLPYAIMLVIWYILAVPYIPSVIPGTDSQPTFSLVLLSVFALLLFNHKFVQQPFITREGLGITLTLLLTVLVGLVFNHFVAGNKIYVPRLIAFTQFLIALFFGASKLFYLPEKWLFRFMVVYVVFTAIYYATGGMVEDLLIKSRGAGGKEVLAITGRGARTLSPEPSILSVHILNMVLLYSLFFFKARLGWKTFLLVLIPLIGSLSGYGLFITVALVLIYYPIQTLSLAGVGLIAFGQTLLNMELSGLRVLFILNGLREYGPRFLLLDASFRSRFNSFYEYLMSFRETFPFGDAFTLFSGGGFVSIISGLGLVGLLFYISLLFLLVVSNYPIQIKLLFFVWLLVYLLSGSFGVPLVGLIVGVFVANAFKNEQSSYSPGRL